MERNDESYRDRLTSLTTHLRKYEKPEPHGYDLFATSYISSDVPWKRIVSDETDSYTAEELPFPTQFEIEELTVQEKERKLVGGSVRKRDLLPSSTKILQHLEEAKKIETGVNLDYMYFKAMQYSEVNKALALDEKFPKPDSNVIRSTFSKEHQAVVAALRREMSEREKGSSAQQESPFQHSGRPLIQLPVVSRAPRASRESRVMATEGEFLAKLRHMITEALGKPSPIKDLGLSKTREPWQFKANPDRPRVQPPKKRKLPWKRNLYPLKTREEKIAELRAKAAPLKPEHLHTDQLPGLWEPELLIETFKTAAWETEEENREDYIETEEDWWTRFHANRKCLEWLKSIPDI